MTLPLPLQLLAPVVCLLGALHDIFRIIRVVSHDALNHIGVFLMKMLVDHGGNDLLPFKKILHHRVVHHVLLVIQGRVILHDRLRSSPCPYSVQLQHSTNPFECHLLLPSLLELVD